MQVPVLYNQRIVDLTMQQHGNVEYMFDVALAVGRGITDNDIEAGLVFEIPAVDNTASERSISAVLRKFNNRPASADNGLNIIAPPGGIGYMEVGRNFIVS